MTSLEVGEERTRNLMDSGKAGEGPGPEAPPEGDLLVAEVRNP